MRSFLSPAEKDRIVGLRRAGATRRKIADITGIPLGTVLSFLHRAGRPTKDASAVAAKPEPSPAEPRPGVVLVACRNCGGRVDRARVSGPACPICAAPSGLLLGGAQQ